MTPAALSRVARSLVAVKCRKSSPNGSGTIIGHTDGGTLILTCAHVVGRNRVGVATIRVGRKFAGHRFELVRKDSYADLALLRTEPLKPCAVPIATVAPHLYDPVHIIGCPTKTENAGPEAYYATVVDARLSGMHGSTGDETDDYTLSAPIGGGMSGGMVINAAGELIGVAYAGDDGAFVSFAASLETVKAFLDASPKS